MFPGPVFQYELLTLARRKRFYFFRFGFGAFLLFLLWANDPRSYSYRDPGSSSELSIQEAKNLSETLFRTIAITLGCAVFFLTPALVAGVIADEKQRKTLHYLLASSLSSAEIVVGKLAARLVLLSVLLGVTLPILVLLSLFGGIDPYETGVFVLCCLTTAFLISAVAMAFSVHARKPIEAISGVYAAGILWLFGPTLVQFLFPYAGGIFLEFYEWIKPLNDLIGLSSPCFVFLDTARRFSGRETWINEFLKMAAVQIAFGIVILSYAIVRLRPLFRNTSDVRRVRFNTLGNAARRFLPRRPCGDDAMLWKEMYVSKMTARSKITGAILFSIVAGLICVYSYDFAKAAVNEVAAHGYRTGTPSQARNDFNMFLRIVGTGTVIVWVMGVAMTAASALSGEREADTWISLIATPLLPEEIVRAKMAGALWTTRWIGSVWAFLLVIGTSVGSIHPFGAVANVLLTLAYLWFGAALGTFFSLVCKNSSRSLIATTSALFFLNGLYLIFFIPIPMESSLRFTGVMPFMEGLSFFSYEDFNGLLGFSTRMVRNEIDILTTGVASFVAYGGAAAGLTVWMFVKFDDFIDRPRTSGWGGKKPGKKSVEVLEEI